MPATAGADQRDYTHAEKDLDNWATSAAQHNESDFGCARCDLAMLFKNVNTSEDRDHWHEQP